MANPKHPLPASFRGIGGYDVELVNNTAYTNHRVERFLGRRPLFGSPTSWT